jgi:hypothetical protein
MKSPEFILSLPDKANEYIDYCLNSTKEVATGSGKIVEVRERHIPTISFFLLIWMPRQYKESINRVTYYTWLRGEMDEERQRIVKSVDDTFQALAADIVANEGKGIFYAKNKLGWTDRQTNDITLNQINANFGNTLLPASEPTDNT